MCIRDRAKPAFNSRALLSVDLPNYFSMIFLADLALLKAKYFEHDRNYSQALEYLFISLKFSQLIKHDANSVLVSYQISQSQQRKALNQLAEMVQRADIQERVLDNLSAELSRLDGYADDGFDLVWSGEQIYSQLMLDQLFGESIFERLDTYGLRRLEVDGLTIDWHTIALILIPEYVLQRGKFSNLTLASWKAAQEQSSLLCGDMRAHSAPTKESIPWVDYLKPNSLGQELYSPFSAEVYTYYFNKRCASQFQLQAVRLLVSIKQYERRNKREIESLSDLIPDYFERLPIDPFSGELIKLNTFERTLYSLGGNFKDNGLVNDADSTRCRNFNDDWSSSLTVFIDGCGDI